MQRDASKVQCIQGEQRKGELEDHLRWHTAWVHAQANAAQATQAVQQAAADHTAAEPRRSHFQQVTAAQGLRPTLAAWERAEHDWTSSQTRLTEAHTRLNQTATALTQAEAATQQAALAYELADQAHTAALPDIQQAQALDAQLAMLLPRYAEEQHQVQAAQAETDRAATEAQAREAKLRQTEAEVEPNLRAAQTAAMRYQQTHAAATLHHTHSTEVLQQAQTALTTAAQHYANFDPEALAQRSKDLELQRAELESALALWRELAAIGTQHTQAAADLQNLAALIANCVALLEELIPTQTAAALRLEQAERTAHLAAQACSPTVAELRAHLEPATPCPVCGAHEHPYAHTANLQLRAVMEGLQTEAAHCKVAWETLLTQVTTQQTQLKGYRQQHAALTQAMATLTQQQLQQQAQWLQHPLYNPKKTAEAWADDLDSQWTRNQAARLTLTQTEQDLRTATRRRDEAQHALDTAQRATTQAAAALTEAQQAEQQAQLAAQTRAANLHQAIATLAIECQALRLTWNTAVVRLSQASEHCETVASQLHALKNARLALFGGKALADVNAQFHTARVRTQQTLATQQTGQQQAADAHSRALEALRYTETTSATQQKALADAAAQLDAELLATLDAGCDVSGLRVLLAYDIHWINRERQALQALVTAMSNAATVETERRNTLAALTQQRPNPDPVEVVQAALTHILAELASSQQQLTAHELALHLDDTRRQQLADMQAGLAQQMATTRTWEQLNELIGSATGNKFRNFAQQFSLDVLLSYANLHLADLSRRYVLQRVSDSLALLVMDQDIGNELRSVHSLSGGESFLVSLALALGLASLSSCRIKVESLFIDEGFGSLDAESLRIAMGALDNLQAQGRKVGVISHVQEMTERIGILVQVERCTGGQSKVMVVG
jgi:exonuclease SbcC